MSVSFPHVIEECEGVVFGLLHYFPLSGAFVVYSAQVQYAVDNHSEQFGSGIHAESFGIAGHGVDADEHVAAQQLPGAVVESYNVGVVIVVEKAAVDLKNCLVVAEYIAQCACNASMAFRNTGYP